MIESEGMQMHLVNTDDFETVKGKYIDVIENTPDIEKYARWIYGKHPTDESLKAYIDRGEMYVLTDGEEIAGMAAVAMYEKAGFTYRGEQRLYAENTGMMDFLYYEKKLAEI